MEIKSKIQVAILGATGSVGQKFISLLSDHAWFEIAEVAASERSAGKLYKQAVNWILSTPLPDEVANLEVKECEPNLKSKIVFSGLDSGVAGPIEENFAKNGYIVISNSKNHRMDRDVPLLVPEINADHLELIKTQNYNGGCIVTNPNCSTIGMVISLKPLYDNFGLEEVNVVTMQALSGAGYPGVASLDIIDNVIPYISGTVGYRRLIFLSKDLIRNFTFELIQNFQFFRRRKSFCLKFCIGEIASGSGILAVEKIFIHPFKIKCIVKSHPHFSV